MKKIRILAVGKLKIPHWQQAAEEYKKRLARMVGIEESIARDADAGLSMPERLAVEAERLAKLRRSSDLLICMDERGDSFSSEGFAAFLQRLYASGKVPCFVIGGAYGLAPSIKQEAVHQIALSAMTFTHEMARVFLLEQIYRAETILAGTGYHH